MNTEEYFNFKIICIHVRERARLRAAACGSQKAELEPLRSLCASSGGG